MANQWYVRGLDPPLFTLSFDPTVKPPGSSDRMPFVSRGAQTKLWLTSDSVGMLLVRKTPYPVPVLFTITISGWKPTLIGLEELPFPRYVPEAAVNGEPVPRGSLQCSPKTALIRA